MTARVVIAGTASGVGKTSVMIGLTRALRRRGLRVAVFKCGPDYLDPTYHTRAAESACHNLDGWMMGQDAVRDTFARVTGDAEIALIEGVMGLFDGRTPTGEEGSTAEIAKWLKASVLLVCDASGMARSVAAMARGFASFDPELQLAGVICNCVGSRGHLDLLRKATGGSPPVIGGFTEDAALAFPERHLGLHAAGRGAELEAQLEAWGNRASEWLDLDAIVALARTAPPLAARPPAEPSGVRALRCRIGIAQDDAFHFYYEDNLWRLEQLGVELVPFSPIDDSELPAVDGLYFGGGYPELHAQALSDNEQLRREIARFAAGGGPVYAECGGLMYLSSAIRTLDGQAHAMVGLVPGEAEMQPKLQALGYVEVETQVPTLLGGAGLRFRGHQFRYSELRLHAPVDPVYSLRRGRDGQVTREGYRINNTLASYVHAHWASNPLVARGFVDACAQYAARAK